MYKKDLDGLIEPFLLEKLEHANYQCNESRSIEFLKHNRFDLAFKLVYLELRDKAPEFARDVYKEHIRAFSLGSYNEPGNKDKKTVENFFESFDATFNDIKENGFDERKTLIPVTKSGTIINGAHRLASSIFLKRSVKCVYLNELNEPNYNYDFFYKRRVPSSYLDFAATKFVEYSENIYIAFVWPTAQGKDSDIEKIIPNIVYRKNLNLNYRGAHNLISQIYSGEHWLGSIYNDFRGAKGKVNECFKVPEPVRIIAFQAKGIDQVLDIKERIRKLFNVGKHSVHITDTHDEAITISQLVFNDNSIHFLNNSKPNKYIETHEKINKFKKFLKGRDIGFDDAILDGSIVLSVYGLRDCADIDYLSLFACENNESEFDQHDSELDYHRVDKSMLIYNQKYYFIFNKVKFVSYLQTYNMKKNRSKANNDKKDINDCKMMEAVLEGDFIQEFINKKRQQIYYFRIKFRHILISTLKRAGLYGLVKKIYQEVKHAK